MPDHRRNWGRWKFSPLTATLTLKQRRAHLAKTFSIDLAGEWSRARWLAAVLRVEWMTPGDIHDFMRAIDSLQAGKGRR